VILEPDHDDARRSLIGVALVLVASVGFSTRGVLIKLAYPYGVDAVTLLTLRMLFSLPLFALMALFAQHGARPISRAQWKMVIALGFIGYYLSSFLSFLALQFIPAGLERLLLYLTPTIVVCMSALLFKQRVGRYHVVALVLSYCGILLVMADNLVVASDSLAVLAGGALAFISALTYSVYLIASGTMIPSIGSARFTAYASGTACCFVIVQFLLARDLQALDLPLPVYAYGATMAVFCTVLPTWMMSEGVRRIGANQSAMISSVGPVSTIAIAAIVLSEPVSAVQICGASLVLAGVWLVSAKRQTAPPTSVPAPTR
jgi:drug/metabolite transporter (DMT)-like permease